MIERILLSLRRLGVSLRPLMGKGASAVFRRATRSCTRTVWINDFDGWAKMRLLLNEHMQRRIFWMGYYSQGIAAVLDRTLRPGMVVVDAGANIGEISLVAARRVGASGRVYAFEPMTGLYSRLCSHIQANQLTQVEPIQIALGNETLAETPIYNNCGQGCTDLHLGLGSLVGKNGGSPAEMVRVERLDDWVQRKGLSRLDLIKIDVEGFEMPLLAGSQNVLETLRPMVVIEIQEQTARCAGYRSKDVYEFLATLGYSMARINNDGSLVPILSAEDLLPYQNVLGTPESIVRCQ